mgnify:CR=1 FL=1
MPTKPSHKQSLLVIMLVLLLMFYFISELIMPLSRLTGEASADGTITITLSEDQDPGGTTNPPIRSGGDSGGGRSFNLQDRSFGPFITDPLSYSITTTPHTVERRTLTIINARPFTLDMTLSTSLKELALETTSFPLVPNQEHIQHLLFESTDPGIYSGKITVVSAFGTAVIPVFLKVISPFTTFDLALDIPSSLTRIQQQEPLLFRVTLDNLEGGFVELAYVVKDAANNDLLTLTEVLPVNTHEIFEKTVQLPSTLPPGTYLIGVIARYKGMTNVDTQLFKITTEQVIRLEEPTSFTNMYLLIFMFILVIILFVYTTRKKISHL